MIAYVDTHIILWLAAGRVNRLSSKASALLERTDLLLSAMAFLELEYLYELGKTKFAARDLLKKASTTVVTKLQRARRLVFGSGRTVREIGVSFANQTRAGDVPDFASRATATGRADAGFRER